MNHVQLHDETVEIDIEEQNDSQFVCNESNDTQYSRQ